ncbi:MAG TPA: MmcQ/YjbR family DNA-binding protein [Acidimicrobiales bacterium]|nr:MmcQ/YjbR family DNA-binding protein [Acidimicrobiales bacterium]
MATAADVSRIAAALPEAEGNGLEWSVTKKGKARGFVWIWKERVHPKKARVPNPDVLAIRVADLEEKEMLLASDDGSKFFTESHYNGFPAVLVRLDAIDVDELTELITDAWEAVAR